MSDVDEASGSAAADSPGAAPDVEARAVNEQPAEQDGSSWVNPCFGFLVLEGNGSWEVVIKPRFDLAPWFGAAFVSGILATVSAILFASSLPDNLYFALVPTGYALLVNAITALVCRFSSRALISRIERISIGEEHCTIERTEGRGWWWGDQCIRLPRSTIDSVSLDRTVHVNGQLMKTCIFINFLTSRRQRICFNVKPALQCAVIASEIAQQLGVAVTERETVYDPYDD